MKRSKLRKATLIGITLMIVTILSIQSIALMENRETNPVSMPPNWYESFDIYEDGQFLDGTDDDGGWEGWDDVTEAGAYVTSDYYLTPPHSVDIVGGTDLIHQFEGYTTGRWNFSCWVYIPGDSFEGVSAYIMLSRYFHGGGNEGNRWVFQPYMDSFSETVYTDAGDELPLVFDRWVQWFCEIDLDSDFYTLYYDGEVLEAKEWTAGPFDNYDGDLNIGCLDLYANGATSVYYDDIAFRAYGSPPEPDLSVAGSINLVNVTAGSTNTGSFTLTCLGAAGSTLNWEIESFPDWGEWTITPDSGSTDYGDRLDVEVSVIAPDEQNSNWTGEIKIVNTDNSDDFGIISCFLSTPKVKQTFIQSFFDRFPILRNIFGLYI
jgi:hypothetical protein